MPITKIGVTRGRGFIRRRQGIGKTAAKPPLRGGGLELNAPITVRIKRLPHGFGVPLPARMTEHAAGFDLSAAIAAPLTLAPGDIKVIPCGFAMAVPPGFEAQVRPRSGMASRHGVTLVNSPGTIDADYRGEVMVPLINHGRSPFVVEPAMRIAQLLILPVPPVQIVEADELGETTRGAGGFGHTGS
jgi:dUTP pyrophosphatase